MGFPCALRRKRKKEGESESRDGEWKKVPHMGESFESIQTRGREKEVDSANECSIVNNQLYRAVRAIQTGADDRLTVTRIATTTCKTKKIYALYIAV